MSAPVTPAAPMGARQPAPETASASAAALTPEPASLLDTGGGAPASIAT
jgi:hypothetical protein